MLVVIAILASMSAIVLPPLFRPMAKSDLQQAAKQVQAALLETRSRAIDSGIAQEFRYEPGGRLYEIRTSADSEDAPAAETTENDDLTEPGALLLPPAVLESVREELPEGVVFADPSEAAPASFTIDVPTTPPTTPPPLDDEVTGERWSAPIRFYSNGKGVNARLKLRNGKSWSIEILLRGLLGTSLVGEPQSERESQDSAETSSDSEPPADDIPE